MYCAESPAAALLEVLVHFEIKIRDLPARYRLLKINAPDDIQVERVTLDRLSKDWPQQTTATRAIGDTWLANGATAMLRVPAALVPETSNVLLNPAHRDARRIVVRQVTAHVIDRRLLADQDDTAERTSALARSFVSSS